MLIPEFKLNQNDDFVIVVIRVPYVKVTACQFYIEEKEFKFYLKPYLLSLSFEQPLRECEEPAKATYYHDKHLLEVSLHKKNKGQFFENLNLLSNIVSKKEDKKKKEKKVMIEVVGETQHQIVQKKGKTFSSYAYGFGLNYTNVFKNLEEQVYELFSFNPQNTSISERYELSRKIVFEEFDENSYMFDKISNFDEIDRILQNKTALSNLTKAIKTLDSNEPQTYEKFKQALKIPKKQLIFHEEDQPHILKQLLSIVLSYIYELECLQGEMGVQSAKTINMTSGVLSSFLTYEEQSVQETIIDSFRRCIVFSLYKHIDIPAKILKFLSDNLCQSLLVHILTDIRVMFEKSQPRYLLNRIYVDDYCIYVMTAKLESELGEMRSLMQKVKIEEGMLELDIADNDELEISNVAESNGNNIGLELEEMLQFD